MTKNQQAKVYDMREAKKEKSIILSQIEEEKEIEK